MQFGKLVRPVLLFLTLAAMGACNQDSIFYEISTENKPAVARIEGSPTNMVVFQAPGKTNKLLFVASGRYIHWYTAPEGIPYWDGDVPQDLSPPPGIGDPGGGAIYRLAATTKYLYALTAGGLKRFNGNAWEPISIGSNLRLVSIFVCNELLFVCVEDESDNYHIHSLKGDKSSTDSYAAYTGMLTGAAFYEGNCYLTTYNENDGAIYENTDKISSSADHGFFMGILSPENGRPIAISAALDNNWGKLYVVNDAGVNPINDEETSVAVTGALTVWQHPSDVNAARLLLVGLRNGYMEVSLSGGAPSSNFTEPAQTLNVGGKADYNQYQNSLKKVSVVHLFQAPKEIDPNMTLFASTATSGLYSYRLHIINNEEKWKWEVEE